MRQVAQATMLPSLDLLKRMLTCASPRPQPIQLSSLSSLPFPCFLQVRQWPPSRGRPSPGLTTQPEVPTGISHSRKPADGERGSAWWTHPEQQPGHFLAKHLQRPGSRVVRSCDKMQVL